MKKPHWLDEVHPSRTAAPQLKTQYKFFNEEHFDYCLPASTQIYWDDIKAGSKSKIKDEGITYRDGDGTFIVVVNEKLRGLWCSAFLTLLHEMCHILHWDNDKEHGKKWGASIKALRDKGAMDAYL